MTREANCIGANVSKAPQAGETARKTYEDEERRLQAMDLCRPCTEAVLDAPGE